MPCFYQCNLDFEVLGRNRVSMSVGWNRNRCKVWDMESGVQKSSLERSGVGRCGVSARETRMTRWVGSEVGTGGVKSEM